MPELSEQQKEFCRAVAMGLSGTQAYAQAYQCDPKSAAPAASRLLKRPIIKAELDRLTAAARALSASKDAHAIGSKADRMEMLWRMACNAESIGSVNEAVNCVKELNKMDGAYEPEQVQVQAVEFSFESLMDSLASLN